MSQEDKDTKPPPLPIFEESDDYLKQYDDGLLEYARIPLVSILEIVALPSNETKFITIIFSLMKRFAGAEGGTDSARNTGTIKKGAEGYLHNWSRMINCIASNPRYIISLLGKEGLEAFREFLKDAGEGKSAIETLEPTPDDPKSGDKETPQNNISKKDWDKIVDDTLEDIQRIEPQARPVNMATLFTHCLPNILHGEAKGESGPRSDDKVGHPRPQTEQWLTRAYDNVEQRPQVRIAATRKVGRLAKGSGTEDSVVNEIFFRVDSTVSKAMIQN